MFKNRILLLASALILTWGSSGAIAAPAFKDIADGNQTMRCGLGNTSVAVAPDGSAISVVFDRLQVQAGVVKHSHSRVRCNLTVRLVSPVEAATKVQLDVRGAINKTERATANSKILIRKLAHPLTFNDPDAAGTSRYVTTLPKGTRKFSVGFIATAKAKNPEFALVSIDTLDIAFAK